VEQDQEQGRHGFAHKFAQARAASSRMIFCDRSMQLTCVKALHAQERLKTLNVDVYKLN
jgi:hypothetical protein